MIGQQIGQFQIVEKLGAGGMGTVYKAKDVRLNRWVAVKALKRDFNSQSNAYKRFKNEAQISAQISHPNVASLYDFVQVDDRSYIIMELVKGVTLEDRIRKDGKMDEELAINYIIQVLKGLGEAHDMGILHRDLKPSNIMISSSGYVKLMDFGIAKMDNATRLTAQNKVIGTMEYLAPEIFTGKQPSRTSDLYAIGVILYEMLTGETMFKGESEASIMYQIVHHKAQIDTSSISANLVKVIKKLTSKSPKNRFRNTKDLIDALQAIKSNRKKLGLFELNMVSRLRTGIVSAIGNLRKMGSLELSRPLRTLIYSLGLALAIIIAGSFIDNKPTRGLSNNTEVKVENEENTIAQRGSIQKEINPRPRPQSIEIKPITPKEPSIKTPSAKKKSTESTPKTKKKKPETIEKNKKSNNSGNKSSESQQTPKQEIEKTSVKKKEENKSNQNKESSAKEQIEQKSEEKDHKLKVEKNKNKVKLHLSEQFLPVRFNQSISSEKLENGQIFFLETASNIYADGNLAIPAGSQVKCQVKKNKRKSNGKVVFAIVFESVRSMTGEWLKISYPEYSKIEKQRVVFPAGTLIKKIKLESQTITIYQ